ncbi:hypothetical protein CPB83DRAFT_748171, partial [Crepidotus variabilis]
FDEEGHPQQATHYLVIRKEPKFPVILGPAFTNPLQSLEDKVKWSREMVILFKPWRQPLDLKNGNATWISTFAELQLSLNNEHLLYIKNMKVLRECSDARQT